MWFFSHLEKPAGGGIVFLGEKIVNSKKKFVIAICSLGVVALSAVIALVAVIAAFNAKTTDGGFQVSYIAKNVEATIAAEYKVGSGAYTAIKTTDDANMITFTGAETDATVTKSFKAVEDISLGKDDYMYIHYTITNTDTDGGTTFSVTSNSEVTTNTNLTIEYATSENSDTWKTTLAEVADVASVANGTPLNIYVRISVTTKTQSAAFDGEFNFTLAINE